MWFDVRKAVAEVAGGEMPAAVSAPATTATTATQRQATPPKVAIVANVAAPRLQNSKEEAEADAGQLADLLAQSGPTTYGAAAAALGWGATRAWRAEAMLRAKGKVRFDVLGRATLD